ncbi:MAG TPA: ABC transporter substrate-binding protein [Actinomycetota bacterium]|nr:ABC transporter substrate-binding protein [Actinomycetota bacterium]
MKRIGRLGLAMLVAASACTLNEPIDDTAPRTPDPAARPGGTLRVGIGQPRSIDPSLVTRRDPAGWLVVSVMCDTAVDIDPVTGELRPALARRFQSTERGTLVTATLREDVRLHDGSDVGALDLSYPISRAAQPQTVSPSAELLSDVNGFERLQENETEEETLLGVRAVGPLDLEIALLRNRGDFTRVLTHPITAAMPRETLVDARRDEADEEYGKRPVCAGPYRLAEPWSPGGAEIRLVRFEGYHGANAAYTQGGRGYADEIVFRIYPDQRAQLAAYAAGEIDIAHVPPDARTEAQALPGTLVDTPTLRLDYLGLPTPVEPYRNRGVRVALSMALDRERISREVYGGGRRPASAILPPPLGEQLHRPDACARTAPATGDVERARTVLASSGTDLRGQTIRLHFNDEFGHRELAQAVAAQWAEAFGVQVELQPSEWEAYRQRGLSPTGFDGPFRMSISVEYPSALDYLEPLFSSSRSGDTNLSRFGSRSFDLALEDDARRAVTPEDQALQFHRLEDIVCGEMPVIPLLYGSTHYLFASDRIGSAIGSFTAASTALPLLREIFVRG